MEKYIKEKFDKCMDKGMKKIIASVIDIVAVKVKEGDCKAKEIAEERKAMREEAERAMKDNKKKSVEYRRAAIQKRAAIEDLKQLYLANSVKEEI